MPGWPEQLNGDAGGEPDQARDQERGGYGGGGAYGREQNAPSAEQLLEQVAGHQKQIDRITVRNMNFFFVLLANITMHAPAQAGLASSQPLAPCLRPGLVNCRSARRACFCAL